MTTAALAIGAGLLVAGSLETTPGALEQSLAAGHVDSLEVGGVHVRDGDREMPVEWSRGLLTRHSWVVVSGGEVSAKERVAQWREEHPDVQVTEFGTLTQGGSVGPWAVPSWTVMLSIVVSLGTVVRIALGPQPLRIRRWGWFWLNCVPAVGAFFFWMLGDATGRRAEQGADVTAGAQGRRVDLRRTGWFGFGVAAMTEVMLVLVGSFVWFV